MRSVQRVTVVERTRAGALAQLLSCIRLDEVLVLQGTPIFGALFGMGAFSKENFPNLLLLVTASSCLVAHVFTLNDWCGTKGDLRDPNRAARVFTARGVGPTAIAVLCGLLLTLAFLLLIPFGAAPLLVALALAILSAFYSLPTFAMKGVPLASSGLHIIGGLLHFMLGYASFHALDARGLEIGAFFALTFAAGHLTHEARDCESDRLNGIWTNAVKFGRARSFAAGFLLFTIADTLLVVLALLGVVPRILVLAAALYPFQLGWTARTWFAGLTFESVRTLQIRYRIGYAIIGLLMLFGLR